jgi:hypothetical protein
MALNGDEVDEEDEVTTELDELERAVRVDVVTQVERGGKK